MRGLMLAVVLLLPLMEQVSTEALDRGGIGLMMHPPRSGGRSVITKLEEEEGDCDNRDIIPQACVEHAGKGGGRVIALSGVRASVQWTSTGKRGWVDCNSLTPAPCPIDDSGSLGV